MWNRILQEFYTNDKRIQIKPNDIFLVSSKEKAPMALNILIVKLVFCF